MKKKKKETFKDCSALNTSSFTNTLLIKMKTNKNFVTTYIVLTEIFYSCKRVYEKLIRFPLQKRTE